MRRAAGFAGLLLALAAGAAAAYTPEEDLSYLKAYQECQERRLVLLHRKQPILPSEMALGHIGGGRPEGVNFHAYLGCKDALMNEAQRSNSAASRAFDARQRPESRDDWQRPKSWWLPGLGPYTAVFFADLLLGAWVGVIAQRRADRKPPPPGQLIPFQPSPRSATASTVVGVFVGLLIGFMCFVPVFLFNLFTMFLSEPASPMNMFLLTAALIVAAGFFRPEATVLL